MFRSRFPSLFLIQISGPIPGPDSWSRFSSGPGYRSKIPARLPVQSTGPDSQSRFPVPVPSPSENITEKVVMFFTIRLSIFLTLARACDKMFSADHDTMLSLLIKAFGPWAFTFYQTVFLSYFQKGSGQNI